MAANTVPLALNDPHDNPEHYEFLRGQWSKKESVGRVDHSDIEMIIWALLRPIAITLHARVAHEWTIVYGSERIIPDVTLSFPNPEISDGYLVAPAFLVVECRSRHQRMRTLLDKCRLDHHRMGTPHCWIIDTEEECAYECHKEMNGMHRLVDTLTAGPDVSLGVADIFEEFKRAAL
ncbi:MAG TPA: Uma2 family endonuclease [Bryobacteraceae bacterium]|nr:Uma2 family endonuclease [Bryobacteraceae bacterium]